ncbi:MAG: hypothetical protein COA36_17530 [Desulfotalea sp.]|nr:MAG: hypothetical protein COA36_17530 [Desulfotalea sp.]
METTAETLYAVNRLIYFSLIYSSGSSRTMAQYSSEVTELIQRFQSQDIFRKQVEAGLEAMELRLLVLEDGGLRLSALRAESFFAATLTDYGRLLARSDLKAAEILAVHCAIATAFFPTESDLDAPVEDLGAIVITDVIDIMRRFTQVEPVQDDERGSLHPQMKTVAERLRQMPEDNPDRQRVGAGNSWVELVTRILEHMVETSYLLPFKENPGETEYRPTPAYQTAMREGIVYSFHAFRDIVLRSQLKESATQGTPVKEDKDVSDQ